uniref:Uncharacterized protein n=1 Tax=Parascaris univalens TaxID=6257 RepID=A0A914ZYT8_PARUN
MRDYAFDLLGNTTELMEGNGTFSDELYVRSLNLTEIMTTAASPLPTKEIGANITTLVRNIAKLIKGTNFTDQERPYATASTLQTNNVELAVTDELTTLRSVVPPMNESVVEKGAAAGYPNYYYWIALFVAAVLIAQMVAVVACCWSDRNRSVNRMELLPFRRNSEAAIPDLTAKEQHKRLNDEASEVGDDA